MEIQISGESEAKVLKGIKWILIPITCLLLMIIGVSFLVNANDSISWYQTLWLAILIISTLFFILSLTSCKIIKPNAAIVFTLFGKYVGTAKFTGLIMHNPFYSFNYLSTKFNNLQSEIIKVNDKIGNPIEVAAVSVWNVGDTYKASFDVENYKRYINTQFESAVRQMASKYPYDFEEENVKIDLTLRQNTSEINDVLTKELQERVAAAGINIKEARITHLAYAPEIASVMLKRQQAAAVIDAKSKIVNGAVQMVKMAIEQLNENKDIEFDNALKAEMAKDLMLILCSDKEATPVIDIGRKQK